MKTYMLIFAIFFSFSVNAQQKKPITVKISTPTVQCEMCKKRIEDYLKYEEGILKSTVDIKQKKTTVQYLADRTNLENIKTAISNTGYDADDVVASVDSYNELPKCCKKPKQ